MSTLLTHEKCLTSNGSQFLNHEETDIPIQRVERNKQEKDESDNKDPKEENKILLMESVKSVKEAEYMASVYKVSVED